MNYIMRIIDTGVTGFVTLEESTAKKYIEFNDLYWIRELATLKYFNRLAPRCIISMHSYEFLKIRRDRTSRHYLVISFDRFERNLLNYRIKTDRELVQYLLDILTAIKIFHSARIMHRDIKPENIMLHNKRAILIDFSHAYRIISNPTYDSAVCTWYYRAPELLNYSNDNVKSYDEKIDIWSIGSVFFEMIIGKPLYHSIGMTYQNTEQMLNSPDFDKYMTDAYAANVDTRFKYSGIYLTWLRKMLIQDPTQRCNANNIYDTVAEFAKLLGCKISPCVIETAKPNDKPIAPLHTTADKHLITRIMSNVFHFKRVCKFDCTYTSAFSLLFSLVEDHILDFSNVDTYILAALLILDVYVFDKIHDIKKVCKKLTYSGTTFLRQHVRRAIISIISHYSDKLFVSNTSFDFFDNIDDELIANISCLSE